MVVLAMMVIVLTTMLIDLIARLIDPRIAEGMAA